ncbi:MAG: hypothetical protein JWQ34_2113 [Mucilaginibacter sp.]|uniref:hypothetical protein n=1 Tax=Mucilaginibacter sp. TaxID=1882438 RepID=UPI0026093EA4|nr:hypothetical protein [Mucilaginibacter sp.]MDB5003888.1 hypothetical protein [Mucilaginibacter sp.]
MSFWKKYDYDYPSVLTMDDAELIILLNSLTREEITEWLIWNDPNGIYGDEQSLKEMGNIMSIEEGLEIMHRHIKENRLIS